MSDSSERTPNRKWKSFTKNWEFKIAIFVILYFVFSHYVLENTHTVRERGLRKHLKVIPEEVIAYYGKQPLDDPEKLAYVQYATNYDYLNLAIMNFVHLRKGNTQVPNLVILYDEILQHYATDRWNNLYQLANQYNITLKSVALIKVDYNDDTPWAASFTKFHVFNQVEFDRVVFFDSDSMLVKPEYKDGEISSTYSNIDELFKIPKELEFVLPQAYWLNNVVEGKSPLKYRKKLEIPDNRRYGLRMRKLVNDISDTKDWRLLPSLIFEAHKFDNPINFFANHVMVVTPSKTTFDRIMGYVHNPIHWSLTNRQNLRKKSEYDMEILNKYLDNELKKGNTNVGILPHRVYGVLTGEFREQWHERFVVEPQYLPFIKKRSNHGWDPKKTLQKIKLIHFSDSPIPKPWEVDDDEDEDYDHHYNAKLIYCKTGNMTEYRRKYSHFKPRLVDDCDSVDIWNWFRKQLIRDQEGLWYSK
ncbi:GNT1 [Candida margitis]|uniref:GNT1 n=1 Tax=Candida margitis TaxID=1775924 RepID=UPI0022270BCA|nr:GNT1 [Candida margitis]KAI5968877.1 GNT1 [Candida margitis]